MNGERSDEGEEKGWLTGGGRGGQSGGMGEKQRPVERTRGWVVGMVVMPLVVAAGVMGVMAPIGCLVEGPVSLEVAMQRLRRPGGERTMGLVGPASKQRYMDAKVVADHIKAGLEEGERVKLAGELVEILEEHVRPEEGEAQHFVLLALGRVWQRDVGREEMGSEEGGRSRRRAMGAMLKHFEAESVEARKAAVLAVAFWGGWEEAREAIGPLVRKLEDGREDVDVRMAAATALGNLAGAEDEGVVEALNRAMGDGEPRHVELVWNAAGALAKLNRAEAAGTILKLLSREELERVSVYDRWSEPGRPAFRRLTDLEQQRILINTMERARCLEVAEVKEKIRQVAEGDRSARVRMAGREMLGR